MYAKVEEYYRSLLKEKRAGSKEETNGEGFKGWYVFIYNNGNGLTHLFTTTKDYIKYYEGTLVRPFHMAQIPGDLVEVK